MVVFAIFLAVRAAVILGPRFAFRIWAITRTYNTDSVPAAPTAVVFGAGLWRDGRPTPVLIDRVATGVDLYKAGKVQILLMSGGRRSEIYDEPGAMRKLALEMGVPDDAILLDYAGDRSYDTCYRAKHIFGVSSAVLVTQQFHLPRTLFLCQALGLPAVGVPADRRIYHFRSHLLWSLREFPASLTAVWDAWIARPLPSLAGPNSPIPPEVQ